MSFPPHSVQRYACFTDRKKGKERQLFCSKVPIDLPLQSFSQSPVVVPSQQTSSYFVTLCCSPPAAPSLVYQLMLPHCGIRNQRFCSQLEKLMQRVMNLTSDQKLKDYLRTGKSTCTHVFDPSMCTDWSGDRDVITVSAFLAQ